MGNSEPVAMEVDTLSSLSRLTGDKGDDAHVLPRSHKRVRGNDDDDDDDDEDIIRTVFSRVSRHDIYLPQSFETTSNMRTKWSQSGALKDCQVQTEASELSSPERGFGPDSRASALEYNEITRENTKLRRMNQEKDFELHRMRFKLISAEEEKANIERMAEARESSYERALKAQESRELEGSTQHDIESQKTQARLDAVIQEKDDLLLVLKSRKKDADEKAEKMMAEMIASQKVGEDRFECQAVKMAEIEAERDRLRKQLDAEETSSTILADLRSKLTAVKDEVSAKDKIIRDLLAEHGLLKSSYATSKVEKDEVTQALDKALEEMKKKGAESQLILHDVGALRRERDDLEAVLKDEKRSNEALTKAILEKDTLKDNLEAALEKMSQELQRTRSKLEATSGEKDALTVELEAEIRSQADLKENLAGVSTELEENKLDLSDMQRANEELTKEILEKDTLKDNLEAVLEKTSQELQSTRSKMESMAVEKDALTVKLEAEIRSQADSKENLAAITAKLEENKLKLDAIEAKRVELSTTLEAEAGSSARLRHELEQAEAVAKQVSEAKDNTIRDLNYELSQIKKDLSHNKETFERQLLTVSTELSSKDIIIHQLRDDLSAVQSNYSAALSMSTSLQERETEIQNLQDEMRQVRQEKKDVDEILSAARLSTTQYKAKVESMGTELANVRAQIQAVEAEKTSLTSELTMLRAVPPQPIGSLQSQQATQESGTVIESGRFNEGSHSQEAAKMNVDENNSHPIQPTRNVIVIPPRPRVNTNARARDNFISLVVPRRSRRSTRSAVEGPPAASTHLDFPQASLPSSVSALPSDNQLRSPTGGHGRGRGGALMRGRVRSVLRVPRSTGSSTGDTGN